MLFKSGVLYEEQLVMSFGAIPLDILAKVLRDGRPVSHLIFQQLLNRFANLSSNSQKKLELRGDDGEIFIVKTITKEGVNLIPSKNIGVGRHYDMKSYQEVLRQISGFIFVDVTQMPVIRYAAIPIDIIPFKANLTHLDSITLIQLST